MICPGNRRKILKLAKVFFLLATAFSLVLVSVSCQKTSNSTVQTPSLESDLTSIPLPRALSSGNPTLAEFGRGTCIPCKQMKPILETLAVEYQGKLNVAIISVDEYRDLTTQYRIMAIPTQIFFDSNGNELIRHIGFLPKEEIVTQLKKIGIE